MTKKKMKSTPSGIGATTGVIDSRAESIADGLLGFAVGTHVGGLGVSDKKILARVKELLRQIRAAHQDPKFVRKMRSVCVAAAAK